MTKKSSSNILRDIDSTLDQLIKNIEILEGISFRVLEKGEIEGLQKTQNSLCARFLDRKEQLEKKEAGQHIEAKISHFSQLNTQLVQEMAHNLRPKVNLRKSRITRVPVKVSKD